MQQTPNAYPGQHNWNQSALPPDIRDKVLEQIAGGAPLKRAVGQLSLGLDQSPTGSSRTFFSFASGSSDYRAAMVQTATIAAAIAREGGIQNVNPTTMPCDVRLNESPEDFEAKRPSQDDLYDLGTPSGAIGYLRAEQTENGPAYSLGALDQATSTHYSMVLPDIF